MLAVGLCFASLLAGCDMNRERDERRREEQVRKETESMREAMSKYATGCRQAAQKRLDEVSRELAALSGDLGRLNSLVAHGGKDSHGDDLSYDAKILNILKDADVNALASRHLASDFSGIVATYEARVRDARAADERYANTIKDAENLYQSNVSKTKDWTEKSKQQRDDEIVRLEREIAKLETQRGNVQKEYKNVTRHSMLGGTRQERQRIESKKVVDSRVRDIEDQISVKRRQLDYLRNPHQQRYIETRATEESQAKQHWAEIQRNEAIWHAERLKPKKSLTDIVAEFEKESIGKLRNVLSDKISDLTTEVKLLKERIALTEEVLLAIPISDQNELKKLKTKLAR